MTTLGIKSRAFTIVCAISLVFVQFAVFAQPAPLTNAEVMRVANVKVGLTAEAKAHLRKVLETRAENPKQEVAKKGFIRAVYSWLTLEADPETREGYVKIRKAEQAIHNAIIDLSDYNIFRVPAEQFYLNIVM